MKEHTFAVCAYKQSPFLEACIQSLLKQEQKSNIVVFTSTPNDYIKAVSEKYYLPLITHSGGGIANDWNYALNHCDSEYCTIAHQDDLYLPGYWRACQKAFKRESDSLLSFTGYHELVGEDPIPDNMNLRIKRAMLSPIRFFGGSRFVRRRVLSFGSAICCPAVTYHWEQLMKFGFQFDPSMSVSLDWDAWERISSLKGHFNYIPETLMLHRIHEGSETTNAIEDNRRSQEDLMMFRRFWGERMANYLSSKYAKSQDSNRLGTKKKESSV